MQSAQTVGLNSCTCIQGSNPFPSLMHSSCFHWNRLLHCCFSMNINFSNLTCCFRTQFHSTVDFHMCCNVCVSKQCLGNHIRVAEIRKRKACFLIFFFWRSQLETRNKRRWSIFPRRNVAHRANLLLAHTKNILVACVYLKKKIHIYYAGISTEEEMLICWHVRGIAKYLVLVENASRCCLGMLFLFCFVVFFVFFFRLFKCQSISTHTALAASFCIFCWTVDKLAA